ncbi:MAG: hypothetical protein MAG795_01181 [Candidatus Woesearchaeota archaeon]|nr:hypothetical protein [Candidatus Woesearchaeota archaeon]
MQRKEAVFVSLFIITLSITLYFLGSSVTGRVVQTMHCDGDCQEFCKFNTDCAPDQVCCDKKGFGVCAHKKDCSKEYEYYVNVPDVGDFKTPNIEKPARSPNIPLLIALCLTIIAIGIIYHKAKQNHKAKPKKRKKSKK